jgi:cell division protein FtsL
MLRTITVRQSPPPRTSPRRIGPAAQANLQGRQSSSLARFRFGPLLVSAFFCLAGVTVYIWPRVQVVRFAYRTHTSEQYLRELLQAHDQLRFELASLKDPERIFRVATEQLGMGMPRPDQVMIMTHEPQGR